MNRRRFLRTGGLAGGLLLAPLRLTANDFDMAFLERLYVSMGTVVRFEVYHEDRREAGEAVREASSLIRQIHALMSVQEPGSELSGWNRGEVDRPLHPLTASALEEALAISARTGGRFDPTVGAAVEALEQGLAAAPQPDRIVTWDSENRRLLKSDPRIRLDLGGSAKGWAVDRAVEILERRGIERALVNAGGDLRVIGSPPGEMFWRIGLRDPRSPNDLLVELALTDAAIATSGTYEAGGSTLVDPRDLTLVRFEGSASVVARTCGEADGLATSLCVEPEVDLGAKVVLAYTRDGEFVVRHSPEIHLISHA